jgi:hypothetical protein
MLRFRILPKHFVFKPSVRTITSTETNVHQKLFGDGRTEAWHYQGGAMPTSCKKYILSFHHFCSNENGSCSVKKPTIVLQFYFAMIVK